MTQVADLKAAKVVQEAECTAVDATQNESE
jgi:hypothetical protein